MRWSRHGKAGRRAGHPRGEEQDLHRRLDQEARLAQACLCRGRPFERRGLPPAGGPGLCPVREAERQRGADDLLDPRRPPGCRLQATAVPGADPEAPERDDRVGPGPAGRGRAGHDADRRRPLREARHALRPRPQGPEHEGRDRRACDAHADRQLLRQPAPDPDRQERPVRPGRGRRLGVLERAHRLDAGRADRHPRDERAVVDRARPSRTAASGSRTGC